MGPVVNNAPTGNKSGDSRPNNSSNHGPSSHGNSNFGGPFNKNFSERRKPHTNQNHRHQQANRSVNNQQTTSSAQPPNRHHHNQQQHNNNVPPPPQTSQQQQPQPSQKQPATMYVSSPPQLQHQQQQKTHPNHQASVANSANATSNAGISINTPTNKNSQTSSNVLHQQQQHTISQQQPTIQMPIAPDKTSTVPGHNLHMVPHQQPTPTSTNTGVSSVSVNPSLMSSVQPNIHPHLTYLGQIPGQNNHVVQPIHHHQQQQQQPSHHHHHHHHQPSQTQNSHHHNIHHSHAHHAQMAVTQLPVTTSNVSSVAQVHKLPPSQNQDGQSGQQKQQSNQPPPMHVSSAHHMGQIDHHHKTPPGVHHIQQNTLIHHQSQPNPNHPQHPLNNLQQANQITHQSTSVVPTMQQPQQQQPNTHNQTHIQPQSHQHHNTPQITHPQYMSHVHPFVASTYQQGISHATYSAQYVIPNHMANNNVLNQQPGTHLATNNSLAQSPNMNMANYQSNSSKFQPINQHSYHQQSIAAPNAPGVLHHTQQAQQQLHPSRQAQSKGPIPPQIQQQHEQARQMPGLTYPHYQYYAPFLHPNTYMHYNIPPPNPGLPYAQPHIPPNMATTEVDSHLQVPYTSSQPVGQVPHMPPNPVSQSAVTSQITPQSVPTPNPTPATSQSTSYPRVKESKKIPIVDPKTNRALTQEELTTPTSKTASICSSTPAAAEPTLPSVSGSPEVGPTGSGTSSSPVEQSVECSASETKVAVPKKSDEKADSDLHRAQSLDVLQKLEISKDECVESVVIQQNSTLDASNPTEANQIAQDLSRQAITKDKDETSKLQTFDVCDNATASTEIVSIRLEKLSLADKDNSEKQGDSNGVSGGGADELAKQSTNICVTQQNLVVGHVSGEDSNETTTVDEDNCVERSDTISEKPSNHDSTRQGSLENNSTYVDSPTTGAPRTLKLDLRGEEVCLDKDGVSSSLPPSNKLSSMPQSEASTPTQNEEKESSQESSTPDNKSQLTYENGQFSPYNPDGRRKYSRDFLRKIADMLGLLPTLKSNEQKEPPNFTPSFIANAGYNQFNRETAQRRLSQQVNNKPRRVIATTSFQQEVELKTTKNPWKPDLAKSPNEMNAEEIDTDRLIKIFRGHLNKLTPQKYDQLIEKIKLLDLGTKDRMNRVIDLVFDKAVDEPNFCELYANLCKVVGSKKTADCSSIFSYALVKKCQKEFENEDIYNGLNMDERQEEIDNTTDKQKQKQLTDELYEDMRLRRRKYLGTIKLIGEMYKLDLLLPVIIGVCMSRLIESPTSENLECLCSLILTVGAKLNSSQDETVRSGLSNTLTQLQNIANNKGMLEKLSLDVRIRFKILDIIEFRKRGWKPRNQENNPKKLDEIHREAAQEILLKNSTSQRNSVDRKNDERMRKVGYQQPSTLMNELTKNTNTTSNRLGILSTESSMSSSLKPHSYNSRTSSMNHSSPNQNSDVTRLAPSNPTPNSINTSKANPVPRQTNTKPIATQSNVKGSSSLNPTPANKIISNTGPSDRHTEHQIIESMSAANEDMVIQIIKDCLSKYDGHLVLEKERLTEHNETILSLLHKGDVSYQLLISGITDYVEQLGYPTHLLGDIFEHMITEGLFGESEFSEWCTESRWSKARDSSPKFTRYLSEPDHFRKSM